MACGALSSSDAAGAIGGVVDLAWLLDQRTGLNKDEIQNEGRQLKKIYTSLKVAAGKAYSPEAAHMLLESCFKFLQAAAIQEEECNTLKKEHAHHVRVKRAEE